MTTGIRVTILSILNTSRGVTACLTYEQNVSVFSLDFVISALLITCNYKVMALRAGYAIMRARRPQLGREGGLKNIILMPLYFIRSPINVQGAPCAHKYGPGRKVITEHAPRI
jgi:hypothetical protein